LINLMFGAQPEEGPQVSSLFQTFRGIPVHPLIIHAAVVFIPLQIAAAIMYGFVPAWRRQIWWAVIGLAIIGPASAWAAKFSGEAFEQRLIQHNFGPQIIAKVNNHSSYAGVLAYLVLALGAVMLIQVWLATRPRHLAPVEGESAEIAHDAATIMGRPVGVKLLTYIAAVVALVLGVITAYYVFQTGDTGAHIAWTGY
jgi:hypothetical protein